MIIPNSVLMKGQVVVLGRRQGEPVMLRRNIDFQVDFRTPPREVVGVVRDALATNPVANMSPMPAPQVLFHGVRESTALYRARYWLEDLAHDDTTDSEVRTRIYYALQRAGITFSIPAQTVFVSSDDETKRQRHTERELGRRCDAIAKVDLLAVLGAEERRQLASTLHYAPFARGEAMTREGATDDGLYMIVEGEASVRIGGVDGDEVARLRPGQFFGEMSLMTGEKRSATVVAATPVVTYRLDKPAFEDLVRSRPEIAAAVAVVLAERRMGLEQARDRLDDATRSRRRASTKHDLLGRIRGFFNLG
jgi:CRP-like cAMP-binding protein